MKRSNRNKRFSFPVFILAAVFTMLFVGTTIESKKFEATESNTETIIEQIESLRDSGLDPLEIKDIIEQTYPGFVIRVAPNEIRVSIEQPTGYKVIDRIPTFK